MQNATEPTLFHPKGTAYLHCFYFATKTATSIGKNKKPSANNRLELLFMTASWLVGVFVFAILIGDIRDIVLNARKGELRFQKQLDNVAAYMNRLTKLCPLKFRSLLQ